jgi:biotin operon repressor
MKSDGEIMEILAAYDLTGSLRATAELTGCSHHTVAKHVQARDAGRPIGEPAARGRVTDASPNGTLGDFMLALAYEDAERMTGRIGVDEQRLVRIVRTIKAELGP